MSLARTAARLAAVMALAGGFKSPWPTMAKGRVFDSRADANQIVDLTDDVLPIISVCTDDDEGESLSDNNGGPPFRHVVTMAVDLSIAMVGGLGTDAEPKFLHMPETEPELEALLDLFERQVKRVFQGDPTNLWSIELNKIVIRFSSWRSMRYVENDGNVRIAARRLSIQCTLADEDLIETEASDPLVPAPLGPLLEAIIASDSPYAPSVQTMRDALIAAGASQPITIPTLERIRFIEAAQAETQDGVPRGPRPDGVAEVELPTP